MALFTVFLLQGTIATTYHAGVAKLVDARALGARGAILGGSSPLPGTKRTKRVLYRFLAIFRPYLGRVWVFDNTLTFCTKYGRLIGEAVPCVCVVKLQRYRR